MPMIDTDQLFRHDITGMSGQYHNENLTKEAYVYKVFSDGEVTLEKGGDLYGQRSMHCVREGVGTNFIFSAKCPTQTAKGRDYQYCICTEEQAKAIRKAIMEKYAAILIEKAKLNLP